MKAACCEIFVCVTLSAPASLGAHDLTEDYLAGYAQGVLEVKFGIKTASVRADGHTIIIGLPQRQQVLQSSFPSMWHLQ